MSKRFLLLQVIQQHVKKVDALRDIQELEMLVDTYGGEIVEISLQRRDSPHPDTYIGRGKMEWLVQTVKELEIDVIVLNDVAKSSQLFRLEQELWSVNTRIMVWDRVDLILNIFERHAMSTEAKIQIELARIGHRGSRIYGLGGTVLSRQGAGIGTKGLGETNSEIERRLIKSRTQELEKKLKHLSQVKEERLRHRAEQGIGPVALVGYTSAGKTSLFNVLTGKDKETNAGLFTTLDTVVGKLKIGDREDQTLISDTIGFIQNLPPSLIKAFRSTLMESIQSRMLLHVIDAADPDRDKKIAVVEDILAELKITQPVVLVFNKIDLLSAEEFAQLRLTYELRSSQYVSAKSGAGIDELKKMIVEESRQKPIQVAETEEELF